MSNRIEVAGTDRDLLPHRDMDRVHVLYAHYFLAADLMRSHYAKLRDKWDSRNQISQNNRVNFGIYFCSWLGFLGVTSEGFRDLNLRLLLQRERPASFAELTNKSDEIGKIMKKHEDPLRKFRNDVFHLRKNSDGMTKFLSGEVNRLEWAEELHEKFSEFFSEYRILCEVHYILNGRNSESQLVKQDSKRRRTSTP
ncbi:hypothetical protein [Paraburkholderia sp.]|uniref:hypothetical protein n=1 Tax=Paraburkholderia sp. TaxID=1926495 RepID=UPI0025E5AD46|nr:hypothetical protein [Paraburkholderia sp.]